MWTIILTSLALVITWIIGARHGVEAGYRLGVKETVALYNVLQERARLYREQEEAKSHEGQDRPDS